MRTIPNTFFNRLEILFYSALTSIISGVHRIRAQFGHFVIDPSQSTTSNVVASSPLYDQLPAKPPIMWSKYFSQVLLSILIWTILGFSAGFLIGMLNTR